jgi:hypothetical protein
MANAERILFHRQNFQHRVDASGRTRLGIVFGGSIMRKFALLLAAAVIMSAPMLTTAPTESFAAAKAKAKSGESKAPQNDGFWMALGDNMAGKSATAADKGGKAAKGGMGGMGGKKAKKSSKGGMGGMSGGMGSGGMGSGGMGGDSGAAKK